MPNMKTKMGTKKYSQTKILVLGFFLPRFFVWICVFSFKLEGVKISLHFLRWKTLSVEPQKKKEGFPKAPTEEVLSNLR